MNIEEIYLPNNAVIIERIVKKVSTVLITEDIKTNKGIVVAACSNLRKFVGRTIVFRENFSEPIFIEGKDNLLFFRDFESSIYYAE